MIYCSVVILTQEGRIFLAYRHGTSSLKNTYGFVGGKEEAGELPIDCAFRELKEETGLCERDFKDYLKLFQVWNRKNENGDSELVTVYTFEVPLGYFPKQTEPEKLGPWRKYRIEEALRLDIGEEVRGALIKLIDYV